MLPGFTHDGCLPPGDYELTFAELRASLLVAGPADGYPNWDRGWRSHVVDNLEALACQLWQVGVNEIFADGSFVEDKEHPNDIDGYFVCGVSPLTPRRRAPRNCEDQERRPAMIRNESEYQGAVRRLQEERARLNDHKAHLEGMGLGPDEVKRAIDPLRSFHDQLGEELESYERLKRGDIAEMMNLHGLGRALVALRIALGLTQGELASRLGVHESQVSRDERNEYHNITVERASRILDALGVRMRSEFEQPLTAKDDPPQDGPRANP